MPERVDFYLLDQGDVEGKLLCACKVAGKAYQQGLKVFLRARDPDQARQLDQLLWSYHPASFVPHGLAGDDISLPALTPVLIGSSEAPTAMDDLPDLPDPTCA